VNPDTGTETAALPRPVTRARVARGLRTPANWLQLIKFGLVGLSGFVVNFCVYAFALHVLDVHYMAAATVAFCFAVANNFMWNRHWTFRAQRHASHPAFQAARFLTVAVSALVPNLILLNVFVEHLGMGKMIGQVLAVCLVTPISFLGNKLWSFR
jgi:dolichol-phosphate mannosyltransferase